jgi:fluoroquinolone resistance protein
MGKEFIEEKTFEKEDFTLTPLAKGEYEYCNFISCNFSNGDLSGNKFLECKFAGCNMSLAKLNKTAFRDIVFKDCKMLGLNFENCDQFGFTVSFDNCMLNHSSFYQIKLKKTKFKDSKLQEVDFTECDLSSSLFDKCDLSSTKFENTILEKADFRTAFGYSINPEINRIRKARFSIFGIPGLLDKYDIDIDTSS